MLLHSIQMSYHFCVKKRLKRMSQVSEKKKMNFPLFCDYFICRFEISSMNEVDDSGLQRLPDYIESKLVFFLVFLSSLSRTDCEQAD